MIIYMISGLLVVNSFVESLKFKEIYDFFINAANNNNINLTIKRSSELIQEITKPIFPFNKPDFVLFYDKDIYLAKRIEMEGIRVFNSSDAIMTCDNKIKTVLKLQNQVKMPKTFIVPKTYEKTGFTNFVFLNDILKVISFPFIIKEAYGSFGQQVYLVNSMDEAINTLKSIGSKQSLIQEFISSSKGRDFRVNVVDNRVVSSIYRENKSDFRSNITNGGVGRNEYLPLDFSNLAIKVCRLLNLDFAGVDILFGKDGEPILCEVNSNPHFKSSYEINGVDMSYEILSYIKKVI